MHGKTCMQHSATLPTASGQHVTSCGSTGVYQSPLVSTRSRHAFLAYESACRIITSAPVLEYSSKILQMGLTAENFANFYEVFFYFLNSVFQVGVFWFKNKIILSKFIISWRKSRYLLRLDIFQSNHLP